MLTVSIRTIFMIHTTSVVTGSLTFGYLGKRLKKLEMFKKLKKMDINYPPS